MEDLRKRKLVAVPAPYKNKELKGMLITEAEISKKVKELGRKIGKGEWHCVVVLNGAVFFAADLMRQINCTFDTVQVKSYSGKNSSRTPIIVKPLTKPLNGRNVLIVEDIVDKGYTIEFLIRHCKDLGAKRVRVASMLSKPDRREVDVRIDYLGFIVPDEFIVGYGLDCDEKFRTLPFVAVIK
ncbi:MAG: hypoxanthine phosphoribosyltransferase [Candidatus Woesearchaeota archaeon]